MGVATGAVVRSAEALVEGKKKSHTDRHTEQTHALSFTPSLTHSFTHSLLHPLTHSLTPSLTHSLAHTRVRCSPRTGGSRSTGLRRLQKRQLRAQRRQRQQRRRHPLAAARQSFAQTPRASPPHRLRKKGRRGRGKVVNAAQDEMLKRDCWSHVFKHTHRAADQRGLCAAPLLFSPVDSASSRGWRVFAASSDRSNLALAFASGSCPCTANLMQ